MWRENMNAILLIVVVALWSMEAWNLRNKKFTVYLPVFKINKTRNKKKVFKTYRYVETKKGTRCIEEQRYRVI